MEIVKRIIVIGNSLGFIIDKPRVIVLGLKKGDYVKCKIEKVYKSA